MRRKEVAAEFKVSLATLRRLEIELFRRGEALRCTPPERSSSYVVLLKDAERGTIKSTESAPLEGVFKSTANDAPAQPEQRSPITQTENSANPARGEHTPNECAALAPAPGPAPLSGVCSPRDAAASHVLTLPTDTRERVRLALAAYGMATRRKRCTTLAGWVSTYLAAFDVVIAPRRLVHLIAEERLARLCTLSPQ